MTLSQGLICTKRDSSRDVAFIYPYVRGGFMRGYTYCIRIVGVDWLVIEAFKFQFPQLET